MRLIFSALVFFCAVAFSTNIAHAYPLGLPSGDYIEGTYDFTYTEGSTGSMFSFTLGPSMDVSHADYEHGEVLGDGFLLSAPPGRLPPGYSSPIPASIQIESFDQLNVSYSPTYLFKNPYEFGASFSAPFVSIVQDPQTYSQFIDFLPATYTLAAAGGMPANTLRITEETGPAVIPEPPSVVLFATGAIGLLALGSRRLLA